MFKKQQYIFYISLLTLLLFGYSCKKQIIEADLILANGSVFTVNQLQPKASCLAILGDRILAVGDSCQVYSFAGKSTQILNLEGKFVCPGFNDAHVHLLSGVKNMLEINVSEATTMRELQRIILREARKIINHQPNTWLVGRGWDQNLFFNGNWPTRRYLDAVSPHIPIFLMRVCGHAAWVNRKALQIAGINKDTPDPEGGEIMRDPNTGEPTGILKEEAIKLVAQYIPESENPKFETTFNSVMQEMPKLGITSLQDMSEPNLLNTFYQRLKNNEMTCRVSEWVPLDGNLEEYNRLSRRYGGNKLRFGILKGFMDGSMGARTACFETAYHDSPNTRGLFVTPYETMSQQILQADRQGFQIGIHCIGDLACKKVLDLYETAQQVNGMRESRHRIEHAQVVQREDMPRFKKLNIIASMQPFHCVQDMAWAEQRIGRIRCENAYAWNSLHEHGTVIAFGTDWPVAPLNPLLGLYAAVTRKDTLGQPVGGWNPQERLSIEDAIEAYTLGSAYAEHMEKEKGSLERGKLADIVVLDKNLLDVDPVEYLDTNVILTILGGKIIYQKQDE